MKKILCLLPFLISCASPVILHPQESSKPERAIELFNQSGKVASVKPFSGEYVLEAGKTPEEMVLTFIQAHVELQTQSNIAYDALADACIARKKPVPPKPDPTKLSTPVPKKK